MLSCLMCVNNRLILIESSYANPVRLIYEEIFQRKRKTFLEVLSSSLSRRKGF